MTSQRALPVFYCSIFIHRAWTQPSREGRTLDVPHFLGVLRLTAKSPVSSDSWVKPLKHQGYIMRGNSDASLSSPLWTTAQFHVWMIGSEWQRQLPNCQRFLLIVTVFFFWPAGGLTAAFGLSSCKLPFVLWRLLVQAVWVMIQFLVTKKRLFSVFFFRGLDLSNRALHWLTFKLQWWNIYAPEQLIMRAQFSARVSATGKIIWIGLFIILLIYKVHIFWSVPFCTSLRGAHNRRGEPWVTAV